MKILITGATGLIGKELVRQCLDANISVNYLTTSKSKITLKDAYKGFYWNPSKNEIDVNCLKDVTAVIHLAGSTIAKRWTSKNKSMILKSRVQTANVLFQLLSNNSHNVSHFISASAIGIYPNSLTNFYSEDYQTKGNSFLSKVVLKWEQSVNPFASLGLKVTKIRIGLVFDKKEGALPQIVNPIKFGLGAAFGTGLQWQSWIHIQDLAGVFLHVLNTGLEGVYNAVAPNSVTNKQLTQQIAKQLKKPLLLPNIPKSIMKFILGEMHILLFESQRVSSKKIQDSGYCFKYYKIEQALEDLLNTKNPT